MSRLSLAVAVLALSASAADKDNWLRITSPHFEVYTDAGERAGRDVAKHFEQVHGFFLQRFKTGIDGTRKARVILFRNEKEYEPYRPNQSAAAFFHTGEYHDFIVLDNSGSDWRPTAVHELTHLMVRQLGADLPLWLNEGLAELYSNMEPRGAQMMVGRDVPGRMQMLASEQWIGLPTLLAVNHESPIYNEKARSGIFYAESWKLVHMLHLGPAYDAHLTDFLRALLKGDAATAFQTAYGKDLATVENDLRNYLSGNTISAMLFNIPLPKATEAPEVESGASLFARLAIAELLSNTRGRAGQASEAYSAIERDFPDRWEVEEAMGLFAWHERRREEADRHFARAEQMGSKNGSMFLLWGRVLGYSNRTRDSVTALDKAVKLMPNSVEAQLAYGDALIRNGNWGAAVASLREVKGVPPVSMWRYSYNLAFGLYRLGEIEQAKPFLANARKFAANPRENASLDQLETALNRPVRSATVDGAAPRLVRRDGPASAVEGTLESLECGQVARLHVRTGDAVKIFVMPDPRAIRITSGTGESMALPCGPQKAALKVRVEYEPMAGSSDAAGQVRSIEFR